VVRAAAAAATVLALAGCGSTTASHDASPPAKACVAPGTVHALRKLAADTAAIRAAAALPTKDMLKGNAAVNHATDRFLLDEETAPISNVRRNRLIDHAAAALAGACEQCFQALEADRPLVWIAKGAHAGDCQK
jgi:hypothetical protein